MNRDWVLFHLREARAELDRTICEIERDQEYGYGDYWPAMQHLYHHINTAWNGRDATVEEAEPGSDEAFNRWSKMPADLPMMEV